MKKSSAVKKLTAIAGIAALAISLASCSSTGGTSNPSASVSGKPTGTLVFPSFWWADAGSSWQISLMNKFKVANPQVTVQAAPVPFPDYMNKMYTSMASGQAPDVVSPYDPQIGQWARQGLLQPLDSCLADHGIDTSKLLAAQKIAQYNGKTYGLLYYSNPRVLVYNKKTFSDAGLDAPKNIKDFQSDLVKLRDKDTQQFGYATVTGSETPAATYLELMPIVAGFGGAFVTDGKATADSDKTVAALDFIKNALSDDLIPKGTTQSTYRQAFVTGKVASATIGGFIVGTAKQTDPEVGAQLSAEPLPFPSGKTIAVNVFLSIPKGAKNPQAACDYIAMSLSDDLQQSAAATVTAIPATGTVPADFVAANPYFKAIQDAAKTAASYAPTGAEIHEADIEQTITNVYQELLSTDMTAKQAGAKMQQELTALLK